MRILFIVPYTPNLIRVRSYNLIRYLSDRGHNVTVLTLSANSAERRDAEALTAFCDEVIALPLPRWRPLWNCLTALPSRMPLQSVFSWQPLLANRIEMLLAAQNGRPAFDVVHVEHLRGVRYGLHLKGLQASGMALPPVVWDSVDCISALFQQAADRSKGNFGRWVTRFELGRTERYERWLLSQFNKILVTSPVDKLALDSLVSSDTDLPEVTVLQNGVDLHYFRPNDRVVREPATLVVSGKMSYHANGTMVFFLVDEIMPRIWERRPDVRLTIVGKDPPREIQALNQKPLVTVTGTVTDIRPYLQRATVAVAPIIYGAGIQNKVLEAMACATPVVATPEAANALSAAPDKDLLVAGDAAALSERILSLLEDPDRRREIGGNGRAYVELNHNWQTIAARLEEIYGSAAL